MTPKIILIHPPVAKCSEPPAGLARLSAYLTAHHIGHELIDANLEGILFLLQQTSNHNIATDSWTRRATTHQAQNLAALKVMATYQSPSRYQRAVMDINRLLSVAGKKKKIKLSLADYQDENLAPVKSSDIMAAAERPQYNPFYSYFQKRLTSALHADPEFIGFSVNYLSQALCAFAMTGLVKQMNPRQKIIMGGSLITSWMKLGVHKGMFGGLVDELVEGEGEKKLLEILGIQDVQIQSTPAYDDFPLNQYLSPGLIIPYSSARGCYWHQCAFCPEKAEGNAYQPLGVSRAINELQTLTCQMNPALIHLLDSSISPSLLRALSERPPGAPWYGFARITDHLADEDFCFALKQSGCVMLKLGIESGDQHILDRLNKGITLSTVSEVLNNLKKAGIATYGYFLFGTPPENEERALKTMEFVLRHHQCIDFLNLAIFNLPARSAEVQGLSTYDFYEGNLSLYRNFKHPLGWNRPAVRHFLEKIFKKHSAIAPIVRRTPDFFTSNHAPFFVLMNQNTKDRL
jgi:radical SAM superfamily enzyme YgiQ (UPF0313 family)